MSASDDVAVVRRGLDSTFDSKAQAALARLAARVQELESEVAQWRDSVATEALRSRAEAAEARVRELEAERDVLFKGEWAMLVQRFECSETEVAKLRQALALIAEPPKYADLNMHLRFTEEERADFLKGTVDHLRGIARAALADHQAQDEESVSP